METPSRRNVLTVAAVAVTLPMLESAVKAAQGGGGGGGGGGGMGGGRVGGGAAASAPAEKPGWFPTTVKPDEVKENEFTAVTGHVIVLARTGKSIVALSSKCTHRGCAMTPTAGAKTVTCRCHNSQFNLDGTVAKGPATKGLDYYAIRLSDKGVIEIDPGKGLTKDDKDATLTLP